jgi:hypothetical protein
MRSWMELLSGLQEWRLIASAASATCFYSQIGKSRSYARVSGKKPQKHQVATGQRPFRGLKEQHSEFQI